MIEVEKFNSSLGEVAVGRNHLERDRSDSSDWELIKDNFSEEKLVSFASFEKIEEMELEHGSVFPNIRLKVDGNWKRLFFHVGDEVEKCFKRLKYRWHTYQQNN